MDLPTAEALFVEVIESKFGLDRSSAVEVRKVMDSYVEALMQRKGIIGIAQEVATNAARHAISESPEILDIRKSQNVTNQRINKLENSIKSQGRDIQVLKSDVSNLKSDVSNLKSDVATLKSDVATLKSDSKEARAGIEKLIAHLIPKEPKQ